jgi:hypothetical protein
LEEVDLLERHELTELLVAGRQAPGSGREDGDLTHATRKETVAARPYSAQEEERRGRDLNLG